MENVSSVMPRSIYIYGVAVWTALVLLFPAWEGRTRQFHTIPTATGWHDVGAGRYPLKAVWAPVWDPPSSTPVRWPWQPVTRSHHAEIKVIAVVAVWSLGVVVLGLVVGAAQGLQDEPHVKSRLVRVGVAVSIALVAAWFCCAAAVVLSLGAAWEAIRTPPAAFFGTVATVAVGVVGGLLYVPRLTRDEDPALKHATKRTGETTVR